MWPRRRIIIQFRHVKVSLNLFSKLGVFRVMWNSILIGWNIELNFFEICIQFLHRLHTYILGIKLIEFSYRYRQNTPVNIVEYNLWKNLENLSIDFIFERQGVEIWHVFRSRVTWHPSIFYIKIQNKLKKLVA